MIIYLFRVSCFLCVEVLLIELLEDLSIASFYGLLAPKAIGNALLLVFSMLITVVVLDMLVVT